MQLLKIYLLSVLCICTAQLVAQCDYLATVWSAPGEARQLLVFEDQYLLATDMGIYVLDEEEGIVLDHWNRVSVGLPSNQVEAMAIEPVSNSLYIGTYDIGVSIRSSNGEWEALPYPDEINNSFNPVRTFCLAFDPLGRLWVGTSEGLLRYETGVWTKMDLNELSPFFLEAWEMEKDADGELIIAGNILLKTAGDSLYALSPIPNGQDLGLFSYSDATLHTLSNGHIWYLTDVGEAGYYDGEMWTIYESFDEEIDFYFPQTEFIFEDENGSIWFYGGDQENFLKFTDGNWEKHDSWKEFVAPTHVFRATNVELVMRADSLFWPNEPQGISQKLGNYPTEETLVNLHADALGDVWGMTYLSTLYNLSKDVYLNIEGEDNLYFSDFSWSADGSCWIRSFQEIIHWKAGNITRYNASNAGFPSGEYFTELVVDGQNRPWAFHWDSHIWFNFTNGAWKPYPIEDGAYAYYATPTADGIIYTTYLSNSFQLWSLNDQGVKSISLSPDLSMNKVWDMEYDQLSESLYLIGVEDILAVWQNGEWSNQPLPAMMDQEDGFRQLVVTPNGIVARGEHQLMWEEEDQWCYQSLAEGLFSTERMQSMAVDKQGIIWLSHHSGKIIEQIAPDALVHNRNVSLTGPLLARLQPNIISDFTHLVLQAEFRPEDTSVDILDLNGRHLLNIPLADQNTSLSVANLASGMYFVRVRVGAQEQLLRFCKL